MEVKGERNNNGDDKEKGDKKKVIFMKNDQEIRFEAENLEEIKKEIRESMEKECNKYKKERKRMKEIIEN